MGNQGKVRSPDLFSDNWGMSYLLFLLFSRQIFAFERDRKRYGTLKSMLLRAGCSNVEALNGDFLSTDFKHEKYSRVTHM